ncbi:MAG: hypothetical protein LBU60_02075 [Clostridiales bacterium]|jgi:transposase-like protein|nr:hypothetical protein [Clostridiales bacterium]
MKCKNCSSLKVVKNGHSLTNSQVFKCKNCGHKFVEFTKGYSKQLKHDAILYYRVNGHSNIVAKQFDIPIYTLLKWVRESKEERGGDEYGLL